LLTFFREPGICFARLAKLAFEVANAAAQELPLLSYSCYLTLGLIKRASVLVHRRLGRLHGLGRSLRLIPG
jgi:hypothetical protein